ncbi:MAG: cytochrome c biogenesis protein CcsA [Bacteroidia bacterium]
MKHWWKILAVLLLYYTIFAGLLFDVPRLAILNETIRNLYFHVTMWFGMMILLTVSVVNSIKYLSKFNLRNDLISSEAAKVGMLFGLIGLVTGMLWAKFTWGAFWVSDVKLNGAAATLLVYSAYFLLRNSVEEEHKRAKLSSVYSIFSFSMMIVFVMVLPRLTDSLHPGNGGNPGFGNYDLDGSMRWVFYPAVAGWTLLGVWILQLRTRLKTIEEKITI